MGRLLVLGLAIRRAQLEAAILHAIDLLDAIDGDPDLEPGCEDEGAQCDDEGTRGYDGGEPIYAGDQRRVIYPLAWNVDA